MSASSQSSWWTINSTCSSNSSVSDSIGPLDSAQYSTTCKLVWGISGKNFKPGLMLTTPFKPGSTTTTGSLIFLPMAKSFKTPTIDEPTLILESIIKAFQYAQSVIPSTSRFSKCFTHKNEQRLRELACLAKEWEANGNVPAGMLAKGAMLQRAEGDLLDRLRNQPNIYHILGEAVKIFSCTEIGIPSPSSSRRVSTDSQTSSGASTPPSLKLHGVLAAAPPRIVTTLPDTTATGSEWLYLEKHKYHQILQSHLDFLLPTATSFSDTATYLPDSITTLPASTLQSLISQFTEIQLSLNIWFTPYSRREKIEDTVTTSVADAVAQLDLQHILAPADRMQERMEMIAAAEKGMDAWVRDAAELRANEHDFNVWNLALHRCLGLNVAADVVL